MTSNTVGSKKSAALASASGATWIEDEKSWSDYQGLSVLKRMDMIKSVLKEGISQTRDEATAGDHVMGNTMKYLQEVLPADLRTSLPWSALVNLINTGLAKVGWSITGAHESEAPERGKTGKDCEAALTEALQGVTHWLPDAALNHTATPTTTQTVLGPVKSWQDYRVSASPGNDWRGLRARRFQISSAGSRLLFPFFLHWRFCPSSSSLVSAPRFPLSPHHFLPCSPLSLHLGRPCGPFTIPTKISCAFSPPPSPAGPTGPAKMKKEGRRGKREGGRTRLRRRQ